MTATDRDQAFKAGDAASYDAVAGAFGRLTERYSAPLARRLVDRAELTGEEHVLDVGTGTGLVAREAARRLSAAGRVVGIDLSARLLERARDRSAAEDLAGRIEFDAGDAEALEFDAGSFDVVLSLFALLHFPRPAQALREMHRVLRPGGRLVVAFGGGPPLWSPQGLLAAARRVPHALARRLGRRLEAPRYLELLVERHLASGAEPEQTRLALAGGRRAVEVRKLIRSAGFREVRSAWRGCRFEVESAQEFWELQATFSSLARKRLAGAPPERLEALRGEFFSVCHGVLERGGRLLYPSGALIITATRSPAGSER